jgi:hypothetical protein
MDHSCRWEKREDKKNSEVGTINDGDNLDTTLFQNNFCMKLRRVNLN